MFQKNDLPGGEKLSKAAETLLRAYFDAFANLYGIVPLYRAFRIIQKQNPEMPLTEEAFLAFADKAGREEHHYIIAGWEDIYEDVQQPTPPMKREIIAEYLYAVDDFESYEELRQAQQGKLFYVPPKEELLRYAEDGYTEETREVLALGAFLRDGLKIKRADDVLDELKLMARMEENDAQLVIGEVERLTGAGCLGSVAQIDAFLQCYFAMYNNTRIHTNRGFTPNEMHKSAGSSPGHVVLEPNIRHALQTEKTDIGELQQGMLDMNLPVLPKADIPKGPKQKKPGRNDPCPCGSGKKYKRCCGRQGQSS